MRTASIQLAEELHDALDDLCVRFGRLFGFNNLSQCSFKHVHDRLKHFGVEHTKIVIDLKCLDHSED